MPKNKKIWKRPVVGVGGIIAIVAPVVTTVAYDTSTSAAPIQVNLQKLGELLNDNKSINSINAALEIKLETSDFYKTHLQTSSDGTKYWRTQTEIELKKVLADLQEVDGSIFSDDEKKIIATSILKSYSYNNVINGLGFNDNTTIDSTDVSKVNGLMSNPFSSTGTLGISNVGKTGKALNYGKDFGGFQNVKLFDISNSDVLKYFESLAFISSGFKELFAVTYNWENNETTPKDLIGFIRDWNTAVDNFYKQFSTYSEDVEFLKTIPEFKYIQKIEGTTPTNNDEAYKLLLNSNTISKQMSSDVASANLQSYDKISIAIKHNRWVELVDGINTNLLDINNKAFENLVSLSAPTSNFTKAVVEYDIALKGLESEGSKIKVLVSDFATDYLLFASTLLHFSNNLANDVVIKISDDLMGPGLSVLPGLNGKATYEATNFKIPGYHLDSTGNMYMGFDFKSDLNYGGQIPLVLLDETGNKFFEKELWTIPNKGVMPSDYAIYYAMKIEVNGNKFTPRLIVYENDHDDDNALKNVDEGRPEGAWSSWLIGFTHPESLVNPLLNFLGLTNHDANILLMNTVSSSTTSGLFEYPKNFPNYTDYKNIIIWHPVASGGGEVVLTETNHEPEIQLDFYKNQKEDLDEEDDSTTFRDLPLQISNLFDSLWNNWKSSHTMDPLATYTPTLAIKSFTFPSVKFQTFKDTGWDNTHSANFHFDNAVMNYEFKVVVASKI